MEIDDYDPSVFLIEILKQCDEQIQDSRIKDPFFVLDIVNEAMLSLENLQSSIKEYTFFDDVKKYKYWFSKGIMLDQPNEICISNVSNIDSPDSCIVDYEFINERGGITRGWCTLFILRKCYYADRSRT
jgi:hypothetical protein